MFTALTIDNQKIEASYKAIAFCPNCSHRLYPACVTPGKEYLKAKHFFHANGVCCDEWYEPMSEWHHEWQSHVPINQREISINNENDSHIADIYLSDVSPPVVIELQKSNIPYDIKRKRDIFYNRVIWVVHSSLNKMEWVISSKKPIFIDLLDGTLKTPFGTTITKENFIKTVLQNPLLKYEDWVFGFDGENINTRFGKKRFSEIKPGEHLVFTSNDICISYCNNQKCRSRRPQTVDRSELIYINKTVLFQCHTCGDVYNAYLLKYDPRGDDDARENKNDYKLLHPLFANSMRQKWETYKQIKKGKMDSGSQ